MDYNLVPQYPRSGKAGTKRRDFNVAVATRRNHQINLKGRETARASGPGRPLAGMSETLRRGSFVYWRQITTAPAMFHSSVSGIGAQSRLR